jgi:exonuclease SbcD
MLKFIHTADIHLDSPLKSLALKDPRIADLIGGATRRTFEKIIDLSLNNNVDALIIAGDLYDGDLRSMKTASFFSAQMRRLEEAGIHVFMVRGNHDSESTITKNLILPSNVHVFTGHGGVVELKDLGVAIHGVSFMQPKAPESLIGKYKQPVAGLINIGIMHTSLAGAPGHDVYAPCSVNDLLAHGFEYWALGHIHQRRIYAQNPYVVMPGIPQGRDIGESGSKSVTLVEISHAGFIDVQEHFIAEAEFQRIPVDLSSAFDLDMAYAEVQNALKIARKDAKGRYIICRIELCGQSPLHWHLRRDADLFEAEVKERAEELPCVLIEAIANQTQPKVSDICTAGPIHELEELMMDVIEDEAFHAKIANFIEKAQAALPSELRDGYGIDADSRTRILQQLLSEGIAEVLSTFKGSHENVLGVP